MAIIMLVRQDLELPGCILEGGLGRSKLVDQYCDPRRLGRNMPVVLSHLLCPGNYEWWMLERSESSFHCWRLLPG